MLNREPQAKRRNLLWLWILLLALLVYAMWYLTKLESQAPPEAPPAVEQSE